MKEGGFHEGAIVLAAQVIDPPYSARSASIGEIAAARPAGMMAEKRAHPTSDPAATVRATG
ncbi:MAG: hypothetical protein DMF90_15280 [Acidobacteria bacterium]|nr:MAG: hypothetical protein DMF90_15280 [Acidobacteriota bacterium]